MFAAYVAVTALAAAANVAAAAVDFRRAEWVLDNMTKYGVPHSWLFSLGALKAAGAVGLLIGLVVPEVGVAAAVGLVLYFVGAAITVLRAHWYSHVQYPGSFLLLSAAALTLALTAT
jgi:hypothetical protein